ncbi:MAG: DMT family transporter [Reyranella sp.]|nr:DMT family transporter [Reyranella sp.]
MNLSAVLLAIGSAVLFGLAAPVAKLLLETSDPWVLAGILYCGAGGGLFVVHVVLRGIGSAAEARLTCRELPWLAVAVMCGGVLGPGLLLLGLARVSASVASLLLTLEGVLTALLAWFVFKENFDRRIALGMLSIVVGAIVLNWQPEAMADDFIGPAAIVGACLAWALDNNLTRKVSLSDPVQIAMIKGLVAGPVSLGIGYLLGSALPPLATIGLGAVTGFLGYGVSLVLFVLALRHLGTARTGAYFSIAPFVGAVVSVPLFGEAVTFQLVSAGALMAFGVWLHLSERHEHLHEHPEFAHEHRHAHDEHHDHSHDGPVDPGQAHSHRHVHTPLRHAHPHTPDSHHRHSH